MHSFQSYYEIYSESIETEAVVTKAEMNNERNVNLLQNSPLGIRDTDSSQFSTGQSIFEIFLLI